MDKLKTLIFEKFVIKKRKRDSREITYILLKNNHHFILPKYSIRLIKLTDVIILKKLNDIETRLSKIEAQLNHIDNKLDKVCDDVR